MHIVVKMISDINSEMGHSASSLYICRSIREVLGSSRKFFDISVFITKIDSGSPVPEASIG